MFKVVHIPQVWEHVPHDVDNRVRAFGTFLAILDTHAMIHHVLDVAPVLGQDQFLFLCIVLHIVIIANCSFANAPFLSSLGKA
jgi:hypothetical protein